MKRLDLVENGGDKLPLYKLLLITFFGGCKMKKRTTMLMSALFAAGAFALNGNVAKADNVQAVNNNNANSTEVKQNDENSSYNEIVKENSLTGLFHSIQQVLLIL